MADTTQTPDGTTQPASELWWVSVGGNDSEPARFVRNADGTADVFTIGCQDGTRFVPGCGIELVRIMGPQPPTAVQRATLQEQWEAKRAKDRARGISHSYRRFP